MSETTDAEILGSFLDEAGICIATLNDKLLEVEAGNIDEEMISEMFRAAHSMKGSAGFLNLDSISQVTHSLETILDWIRKDKLTFTPQVIEVLFTAFDTVSALLVALTTDEECTIRIKPVIDSIDEVLGIKDVKKELVKPEDELGVIPEWMTDRLSIDDVLEAMVARNSGHRIYALRVSLKSLTSNNSNLVGVYHVIEKLITVQTVFDITDDKTTPWQSHNTFDYHAGMLCFSKEDIRAALAALPLYNSFAWELIPEASELAEPLLIKADSDVDLGSPVQVLEMAPEMEKHYNLWKSETAEELQALENIIVAFENDLHNMDTIHGIFRLMHRLKSSCSSMGFIEMGRIAHNCESLLSRYRAGEVQATEKSIKLLLQTKDFLDECFTRTKEGNVEAPDASTLDESYRILMEEFTGLSQSIAKAGEFELADESIKAAEDAIIAGSKVWVITVELNDDCLLADIRFGMILRNIDAFGSILACTPTEHDIEAGLVNGFTLKILYACTADEQAIIDSATIDMVSDISMRQYVPEITRSNQTALSSKQSSTSIQKGSQQSETVRVDTGRLDHLMNTAGEMIITKARMTQLSESIRLNTINIDIALLENISEMFVAASSTTNRVQPASMGLNDEKIKKIERMVNSFKVIRDSSESLSDTTVELHRHTSTMQNSVIQIRMIPIGPLFQRFHRLVRDLSKERFKQATLVTSGETTELDKKLIDELTDPLTHLIRNSVDHGLESAEDRLKLGKREQACITLNAYHEGGQICVRVQDNGRGLDKTKIIEGAIKHGLVTASSAETMSDDEIYSLIFQPGFSTAEKITNISGRGVGMDIVNNKVNELKGTIGIETQAGVGTTFTIRLPLTLAMIEALLVEIGGIRYAFPLESVREIVEVNETEIKTIENKNRVIILRDNAISLLELSTIIGVDGLSNREGPTRAIITKGNSETMAICVDKVLGDEEIVVKPLPAEFANVKGISGATVLGDGGIALILDINIIHNISKGLIPLDQFQSINH